MAKTYTITSTSINGGSTASPGNHWNAYYATDANGLMVGYSSSFYRAVNICFKSSDLSQFSSKTITGIKLKITAQSGKLPSTTYAYKVRYKYNSTTTGTASSGAWSTGNAGSYNDTDVGTLSASSITTITAGTVYTIDVGTTIPTYGYVIGITAQGNAQMVIASTATLEVTTNETDYTYKLSYNANGGSGAPSAQSQTKTATSAPSITFTISNTKPTYTGRTFKGWADSSSATSAAYSAGGSITLTGNKTIYAVWQLVTYTVSYNANGGSGAPSSQTKTYGVNLTLSSTVPTRTGYEFLGWGTDSSATSATYTAGGTYTANAAATLYAVWKKLTYTIKYNANGGSGAPANQTKTYGTTLTLSSTVPTRAGYTFLGWGTSASATTAAYQPGGSYTSNAAATLYAVWKAAGSKISAGNGTIGSDLVITITKQNQSYTDTISYTFVNVVGTIVTKTANSSATWSIPASLAQQIPNANSNVCVLTCTTYDGNTVVDTSSITITLSIPSTNAWNPTISSVSLTEAVSGYASKFGVYVAGKSKINVQTTAAGVQGSTILSCLVSINDQSLSGTNVTTDFLSTTGTNSYTVTVTDSRGKVGTYSGTFSVTAYSSPNVSITSINRDSTIETDCNVQYQWVISSVNNANDKQYKIEYRENISSASWSTAQSLTNLSAYSGSGSFTIHNLGTGTSYQVRISVKDYFTTATYSEVIKPTDSWVIDVDPDDGSIGFHTEAPGDGSDHFAREVVFEDDVDIYEDLTVNGTLYGGRRTATQLTAPGWYRVYTYESGGSGGVTGGHGFAVTVNIQRHTSSENHTITLRGATSSNIIWCDESSNSHTLLIDKIRYTKNDTTNYGFIDIHYLGSSDVRGVGIDFLVHEAGNDDENVMSYWKKWKSVAFEVVADDPEGETIMAEHTFAKTCYGFGYMGYAKVISTDFNDITRAGVYYLDNTTMANAPANYWWAYLMVLDNAGTSQKTQMVIYTSTSLGQHIYTRTYSGSPLSWSTWWSSSENQYGDLNQTGYRPYMDGGSITVPNDTWTSLGSLELTKGRWLVYATGRFNSSANGTVRSIRVSTVESGSSGTTVQFTDYRAPVSGTYTYCKSMDMAILSSTTTYYLNAYQNSGGDLAATGRLYAVRIC